MSQKKKVLIIDDEVDLCLLLKTYLNRRNYEVYYSHTLKEGINQFKQVIPDILFLDNNLPDGIGWEEAAGLLEQRWAVKKVVRARKPTFSRSLPTELAASLAEQCDVVITGVGD